MSRAPRTSLPAALSTGADGHHRPAVAVFRERALARHIRTALPLVLAAGGPGLLRAKPIGGRAGSISNPQAGLTLIQQDSTRLAIDWQSFNIGTGEAVQFQQPAALNEVLDGNPTQILGRIEANGQVNLMNPSGIIFGQSAMVDVDSLVAGAAANRPRYVHGRYQRDGPGGRS